MAGDSLGWQVAGLFHSALHAVLNAALNSVLPFCHCHPSSVIDSAIHAAPYPNAITPPILDTLGTPPNRQPLTANRFHLPFNPSQLLPSRPQRLLLLGEVEADVAMLGLAEEGRTGHAGDADLLDEPFGGFGIGLETERRDIE